MPAIRYLIHRGVMKGLVGFSLLKHEQCAHTQNTETSVDFRTLLIMVKMLSSV